MQEGKVVVWGVFTNSWQKERSEGKGERDRYTQMNAEFQKNIYFCFIDYAKAFDCVDHSKLRKILKEME